MDINSFSKIAIGDFILKKVTEENRRFINEMFEDAEMRKSYLLPPELNGEYWHQMDNWLRDINSKHGYAWIIYLKKANFFDHDIPCGFFAFKYRGGFNTARISFALKPYYRRKGIITNISKRIFAKFKEIGVTIVEANTDGENLAVQRLFEKLDFTIDTRNAIMPSDILFGELRFEFLWKKTINNLDFFVVDSDNLKALLSVEPDFKLLPETKTSDKDYGFFTERPKTGRYHFVFQTDTTEKCVGLSSNSTSLFYITWELIQIEKVGPLRYMMFTGWGDPINGGHRQFEGHQIGIDVDTLLPAIKSLMKYMPDIFSSQVMANVIGLESFNLSKT